MMASLLANPIETLTGAAQGTGDALMAPGNALAGKYDQREIGADGSVSPFDPRMVDDAANLAGIVTTGAGAVPGEGLRAGASIFDHSNLADVPDVPQFDLPRYNPKQGASARVLDLVANPAVRSKMLDYIEEGRAMGGPKWYNNDPMRHVFVDTLGPDLGNARFNKYMDYVAASSPRSAVPENARNASFYYQRDVSGEDLPAVGDKNPQPYGHMAQRLHQMNANRVAGEGWDPLNNPKPASFAQGLMGNYEPVAIDTHAFRLPAMISQDPRFLETAYQSNKDAPKLNIQKAVESGDIKMSDVATDSAKWSAMPNKNEYAAMEQYYKGLAKKVGLKPAQAQASAWVGGGKLTGLSSAADKPFIGFFEDRLNLTAKASGMAPEDVLTKFIKGEMTLKMGGAPVPFDALPDQQKKAIRKAAVLMKAST